VRELFGDLRRHGESTATLNRLRAAISTVFATGEEDDKVRSNQVRGIRTRGRAGAGVGAAGKGAQHALSFGRCSRRSRTSGGSSSSSSRNGPADLRGGRPHVGAPRLGERCWVRVGEQSYQGNRERLRSGSGRRDLPLSTGMGAKLSVKQVQRWFGHADPSFT
jgi:hypothetical protein